MSTTHEVDEANRLLSDESFCYSYDANGNRIKTIDATGKQWLYTHNSRGLVLTAKDPLSRTTSYAYNANGNLELTTDALGLKTRQLYDTAGHEIETIEAADTTLARSTTYTYDVLGRLTSSTAADGGVTEVTYDAAGNVTQVENPTGQIETRVYDQLGRITSVADTISGAQTYAYDANDNLTALTDALGNITTYQYDVMDRLLLSKDALNIERHFTYDSGDNVVQVTDGLGNETSFTPDILGRIVKRTNALGQHWDAEYDARDNVIKVTDAKGQVQTTTYDALSRVTKIESLADGNVTEFAYNAHLLATAKDSDSGLTFSYDAIDRLRAVSTLNTSQQPGAVQPSVTLTNTYNALDQRTRLTDSTGGVLDYTYDAMGRLTQLKTKSNSFVNQTYDLAGRPTSMKYSFGTTVVSGSTFSYEPTGRLASITHGDPDAGGTIPDPIASFNYGYDAEASITSIDEAQGSDPSQVRQFGYDALQRLISGGFPTSPEAYAYDGQGNRTLSHLSATHETDEANRLLSDESLCYAYDANGNLTSKTEKIAGACSGPVTTYTYDGQDQLIRIDFADGGFASYRYDAFGRRIEKNVDNVITRYVYDGSDILLEYTGASNTLIKRYAHGAETDQPLVMEGGGQRYFFHADHLGSIRRVINQSGVELNSYDYDSYGRLEQATEAVTQPYSFTGREYDEESGLYYYRARYYDPETGRFTQQDPLGFEAGDFNLYRYVYGNPINLADPSGLSPAGEESGTSQVGRSASPGVAHVGRNLACLFGGIASVYTIINDANMNKARLTKLKVGNCGAAGIYRDRAREIACRVAESGTDRILKGEAGEALVFEVLETIYDRIFDVQAKYSYREKGIKKVVQPDISTKTQKLVIEVKTGKHAGLDGAQRDKYAKLLKKRIKNLMIKFNCK